MSNAANRASSGHAVCGIDVGGSGCRAAILDPSTGRRGDARLHRQLTISSEGIEVEPLMDAINDTVREAAAQAGLTAAAQPGAEGTSVAGLESVALGMTGLLSLAPTADTIHRLLDERLGARITVVASDAYTSLVGALDGHPGGIVAAGTGVIGFGTDNARVWRRVDGWGHLLGDEGGGSWIGAQGLRAAFAAYDGRSHSSPALLERLQLRFGGPEQLTADIYTRSDRAGMLASFVPDVVQVAGDGDPVAQAILDAAGSSLARTAVAAIASPVPPRIGLIGGIFAAAPQLRDTVAARLREEVPDVDVVTAAGSALDGALRLARDAAVDLERTPEHPPFITRKRHS
jgi:N-acetylglucosamine kinase-like BadF-type ATPase